MNKLDEKHIMHVGNDVMYICNTNEEAQFIILLVYEYLKMCTRKKALLLLVSHLHRVDIKLKQDYVRKWTIKI